MTRKSRLSWLKSEFSLLIYLTNLGFRGKVCAVILKRRKLAALISLLYLSMAVLGGVGHDHHNHDHGAVAGHSDDCAACQWQTRAATDVPVVPDILFCLTVVSRPILHPATVTPESPFLPNTASRAPPVTPA
ncbi:MAG: hypothetical protein PCFJNLEI_03400 [Verrucomicrobiae bacterium]|nr:hypothetical protein [Verrucomicrobiae bacterium]